MTYLIVCGILGLHSTTECQPRVVEYTSTCVLAGYNGFFSYTDERHIDKVTPLLAYRQLDTHTMSSHDNKQGNDS